MNTLFVLLKPALQILLLILPGLFLVTLGALWLLRRRSKRGTPPKFEEPPIR